jgi:hypothetical protein
MRNARPPTLQSAAPQDPGEKPINSGKGMARRRADCGLWIVDSRSGFSSSIFNLLSSISYPRSLHLRRRSNASNPRPPSRAAEGSGTATIWIPLIGARNAPPVVAVAVRVNDEAFNEVNL